ncbi:V-type ATPase 116kDa subunit family protein [Aquibacillus sediminis]|uniref:V-type ATPase 116kDa subunit family protein n=1 Tax=Aquibacillus sediminis TaxID=2574734 RepID=UPI001109D830|nr:V-type ATPase 116kDa subunit family protein [Aquibacillus sediminis]
MEAKVARLEQRISQVEQDNKQLSRSLQGLQAELDLALKKTVESAQQTAAPELNKVNYLQEVNEQMFQQNVRLRELIEKCMDTNTVPTQDMYYQALKENH